MTSKFLGILALATGLLITTAAAAFAASISTTVSTSSDNNAIIRQLQQQERSDEYKAQYWSQEPITQQDYYVQARQDRQLIRRISAGEPVSDWELKQALMHIDTDY